MRLALVLAALALTAPAQQPASVEFFETRIRPLLAEKCITCHGPKLASGNLRLDSRDALRKGGNRGPAVVPGHLDLSTLALAISYRDSTLKMPPSDRLSDREIDDLTAWIRAGAADPRDSASATPVSKARPWSFEPFRAHPSPRTSNAGWARTWIDHFLLARLDAAKLKPAPETDRRTWIRRVTFDLTGLPPKSAEIDAFLADRSATAYETVVERLLASPHYGERWARHWLDLARYAETDGHEFDREKPNAWRYRDYVIRAFNADLPYDQFVREQIAGDLFRTPRFGPDGLETPLGTGFFALYEERNAADDLGEVRAEKLDNQIDTLGKTFLGLTIACARCHDHKFDPIPTRDYYALGGVLASKQVIQGALDPPERAARAARLHEEMAEVAGRIKARKKTPGGLAAGVKEFIESEGKTPERNAPAPKGWAGELEVALREPDHILHPIARLARPPRAETSTPFADRLAKLRTALDEWNDRAARPEKDEWALPFGDNYEKWRVDGPAFGAGPTAATPQHQQISGNRPGVALANSFASGVNEETGFITSQTFRCRHRYMHVRFSGSSDATSPRQPGQLRVSLVGDGRDAVFTPDGSGRMTWRTSGLSKITDELVFVEIADRSRAGHLAVERIVFSNSKEPPATDRFIDPRVRALVNQEHASLDALIAAYEPLLVAEPAYPSRPFDASTPEIAALTKQLSEMAARVVDPVFGLLSVEDAAYDLPLHKGGSHKNLGDAVPRGFLSALGGGAFMRGSGRMDLADAIASPSNPLTARVFVNRVWKHHFGEGLVRTTDNFGSTGERPSHPELLDTLAARFVASGWSVKALHRDIVLSAAYRMSSQADPAASAVDGDNRFLHHMPVRRLEAEAVRDTILAVSGALDPAMHGPPVPPHISEYQDGRGKPATGPLDGKGRRSIYIGVRRNFLPPLFVAFDYPPTVTTIGRRGVSTVPSQALTLMNNEFVTKQAARWATNTAGEPRARVERMFLDAFGRPAEPGEIDQSLSFVAKQEKQYTEDGSRRAWADLAHALINSKEFIFIP